MNEVRRFDLGARPGHTQSKSKSVMCILHELTCFLFVLILPFFLERAEIIHHLADLLTDQRDEILLANKRLGGGLQGNE